MSSTRRLTLLEGGADAPDAHGTTTSTRTDQPAESEAVLPALQTSVLITLQGPLGASVGAELYRQTKGLAGLGIGSVFLDLSGVQRVDRRGAAALSAATLDAQAGGGGAVLLDVSPAVAMALTARRMPLAARHKAHASRRRPFASSPSPNDRQMTGDGTDQE